jgi:hypothetical protein
MLTGTPLQNDLGELHNLLSFLLPSLFKDAQESEDQNFGRYTAGEHDCLSGMPRRLVAVLSVKFLACWLPYMQACMHCGPLARMCGSVLYRVTRRVGRMHGILYVPCQQCICAK